MGRTYMLALIVGIVGGVSLYGGLVFVSFYSKPLYLVAILAFVVATALFVKPLIVKRARIWFWLVASPLVLFVCSSFGVLMVNYVLDRGKEPVVTITVKGFQGSITPTAAKFYVEVDLTNDSAYDATVERLAYEVYHGADHVCSAEKTEVMTVKEKKMWSDCIEIVADNFRQETIAYLYERLEVRKGTLSLQIMGWVRLRFGSTICEKSFEAEYSADWRGPGQSIAVRDFSNCT